MSTNNYVFVGGLKASFKEETIQKFFGKFGKIESIDLKKNKEKEDFNRGFCVIKFIDPEVAERLIRIKDHKIGKRLVTCRKYLKGNQLAQQKTDINLRKIYISNLPKKAENEGIIKLFSTFGKVEAGYTLKNEQTGFSKGFGFVIFDDESTVKVVFENQDKLILNGVLIKVEKFIEQKKEGEKIEDEKNQDFGQSGGIHRLLGGEGILPVSENLLIPNLVVAQPKPFNGFQMERYQQDLNNFTDIQNNLTHFQSYGNSPISNQIHIPMHLRHMPSQRRTIPLERMEGQEVKKKAPNHPKLLEKDTESHSLRPTMKEFYDMSNIAGKLWHDLNLSNIRINFSKNPQFQYI